MQISNKKKKQKKANLLIKYLLNFHAYFVHSLDLLIIIYNYDNH